MRVDRDLTIGLFRSFVRDRPGRLPVLMYHSISDHGEAQARPYYRTTTSPLRFSQHMTWLKELGYCGVSLEEALAARGAGANSQRLAAITFDDGFRDFHTSAWPILRRYDFTATMFLPTQFISAHRQSLFGRDCLTWNEARSLRKEGARFGSHSVHHAKLYEASWDDIETELTQSKAAIERELEESIHSFSYPFAFPQEDTAFTRRLGGLIQSAGYSTCVTTMIGRLQEGAAPLLLKRIPVNDCDDRALFAAKLTGAYDWMFGPQWLFRKCRSIRRKRSTEPEGV